MTAEDTGPLEHKKYVLKKVCFSTRVHATITKLRKPEPELDEKKTKKEEPKIKTNELFKKTCTKYHLHLTPV